ncbi:MAG: hypothetical protein IJV76_07580 [Clostridia bacterium]|nr:hypothetical protein [Clostridia bacterium]
MWNDKIQYVIPGIALEMEFVFLSENSLKLVGYYPRILGGEGSGGDLIHLGATNIGDIF